MAPLVSKTDKRKTGSIRLSSVVWVSLIAALQWFPAPVHAQPAPLPPPPAGWKLVWSDEFDHDGLPDKTKWDYEEGFVRNHEQQYYTRARPENARVENGLLIIEGRKELFENPKYDPAAKSQEPGKNPKQANYTSASLVTLNKASWQFGRIEVRAKLPQGKGVWPAIWTLGANFPSVSWPACGEIDIMEFVGHQPGVVHATLHYSKNGKHKSNGKPLKVDALDTDFHVYSLDWSADKLDIAFDGKVYQTLPVKDADEAGQNPYLKPHYVLLNLALGGTWGGSIDDAILPQKFLIDYVRVYQRSEVPDSIQKAK